VRTQCRFGKNQHNIFHFRFRNTDVAFPIDIQHCFPNIKVNQQKHQYCCLDQYRSGSPFLSHFGVTHTVAFGVAQWKLRKQALTVDL
jgi:hypothetical protein